MTALVLSRPRTFQVPRFEPWRLLRPLLLRSLDGQFTGHDPIQLEESGAHFKKLVTIDRTLGTNIGDMTSDGGLAAAFDGNNNQASTACARTAGSVTNSWIGKTLAAPAIFGSGSFYGGNNVGFCVSGDPTITLTVRGKNGAAPTTATDGTSIGTTSFTDQGGGNNPPVENIVTSTDTTTLWDHIFVQINSSSSLKHAIAEAVFRQWRFVP